MNGIIILLVSIVQAIEIIDLTKHAYVLYQNKECILADGEVTLIHHVNITQIHQVIEEYTYVTKEHLRDSPFSVELGDKVDKLNDLFLKIYTPRVKRWETIGKVWKWISGSPDADDLRAINQTTNNIINEENKQIIINKQFRMRINKLETQLDDISKATDVIHIYLKLSHSLEYFKQDLEHITQAISFAKQGIIYPDIFTRNELLKLEIKSNLTISEIIHHGIVKIISNNEEMLFIYKLPKEIKRVMLYEILPIKPILKEHRLIDSQGILWNECSPQDKYQCNQLDNSPKCIEDDTPIENIYRATIMVIRKATNITISQGNILIYPPKIVKITEDITVENRSFININSNYKFKTILSNNNTTYKTFTNMTAELARNKIDYLQISTDNLHFNFHIFSISLSTVIIILIVTIIILRFKFRITKRKTVIKMHDIKQELKNLRGIEECQEDSTP